MSADKTPIATPQPETPAAAQPKPEPKPAPKATPPKPIDQAEHGRRRRPHGGEQE